jgi:protein-L-isoaspartate O-methyltransferase
VTCGGVLRQDGLVGEQGSGAAHWDDAYAAGDSSRSWFQRRPAMSLAMLDAAGVTAADSVIDVGGGASPLAGALLDRGFGDVTVLDISATAIQLSWRRLGTRAAQVQWLVADLRSWQPERHYQAWHDRAVLHFMTDQVLDAATGPGAVAVIGCFAPDGPSQCSGLPVARYSPADLARLFGAGWTLLAEEREEHVTPAGAVQPFTWVALRKLA